VNEKRGSLYLLTGLIIGLALGLAYAWFIRPVQLVNTAPAALSPAEKDRYRVMIARAYLASGDLGRASERLNLLQDGDPVAALADTAQRLLTEAGRAEDARALTEFEAALARLPQPTPEAVTVTPLDPAQTPSGAATLDSGQAVRTPTPQPTAAASATPRPSATPAPTQGPPFALSDRREICDGSQPGGLLQVQVLDGAGKPVAGARISVVWDGGEDVFFTGLYPEINAGYADFEALAGVTYTLRVGESGQPESGLRLPDCDGQPGTLWLEFTQP